MIQRVEGRVEVLSPIHHGGDEKTGSSPVLRTMTLYLEEEDRFARLPFISGNAIRGLMRRLLMRDFIERVGHGPLTPKLHHALYTGGVLEATDDAKGQIDLAFRRRLREVLPPIALLGTSIGNQIITSLLKVGHAMPLCREYRRFLGRYEDDPRAGHGVREFTEFAFATRRDDLRAERREGEQAQQMKIEFETFIAGGAFVHDFRLIGAGEIEAGALGHGIRLWQELGVVGGKSASGWGCIRPHYDGVPDPDAYLSYLDEHGDEVRALLTEIGGRLK